MALGKRWSLTFKSLNNVECNVYIYDEGWTGGVTALVGADEPFFYQEDDDESLLTVLRYRTGYLRVVENSYNALLDLYPIRSTSRYVEMYYGERLDFTGYLQVQSFQSPWVASPRVLEFPIISPLGLTVSMTFEGSGNTYGKVELVQVIKEIVEKLNSTANTASWYKRIYIPDVDGAPGLNTYINSLITHPYNPEFSHATADSPVYAPEYMAYIIEGVCNAYGWIVHDTPEAIIFSRFDYDGAYAYYVQDFPILDNTKHAYTDHAGNEVENLLEYFTPKDANAADGMIQPYKSIQMRFDGENLDSSAADLEHTRTVSVTQHFIYGPPQEDFPYAVWVKSADNLIFGARLLDDNSVDTWSYPYGLRDKGVNIAYAGSAASPQERILMNVSSSWAADSELFGVGFINHPSGLVKLRVSMSWGLSLTTLANGDSAATILFNKIGISIEADGQYFNNPGWSYTETKFQCEIPTNGVIEFTIPNIPKHGRVNIRFYMPSSLSPWSESPYIYSFDSIELLTFPDAIAYDYIYDDNALFTIKGTQGDMEGSVELGLNCYKENSHLIGNTVFSTFFTNYDYLLNPQRRVVCNFTAEQYDLLATYLCKWKFWIKWWRWRIVSLSFSPWDDLYTLTLHRSPSIESRGYLADVNDNVFQSLDEYLFTVLTDN